MFYLISECVEEYYLPKGDKGKIDEKKETKSKKCKLISVIGNAHFNYSLAFYNINYNVYAL